MSFEIVLNEGDLRQMPEGLRNQLLKWYFSRDNSSSEVNANLPPEPNAGVPSPAVPRRQDNARFSFRQFLGAGLLMPGDRLFCRTLKRQQRDGHEQFIDAGQVQSDGTVAYKERPYEVPSRLAVDVVNLNGGETNALNGYDYLHVRSSNGFVPLKELREKAI